MATQVLTRKQRGEQIQPEDIEQVNKTSYFVRSQTGRGGYSVTLFHGRWTCDCFDHKYRNVQCKHIHAVLATLPTVAVGLWK